MFILTAIEELQSKMKSGKDFPAFAKDLKALGVLRADTYVINGMSVYFGVRDTTVEAPALYESLLIEPSASKQEFIESLKKHQQGGSDFETFCREAASAGVEKWIIDLNKMTVSYLDTSGTEMFLENIPI